MMKNITILSVLLSGLCLAGCGDADKTDIPASEVPAPVIATFNSRYPGATEARWERKRVNDHNMYEAEFKIDNKEKEVKIEDNGTFIGEEDD